MDICFDCFSGVSGDMLVGALLDIGASEEILKENCEVDNEFVKDLVFGVLTTQEELDTIANKYLKDWRIDRLDKTGVAILRMAIYELKYMDTPAVVVINEAIELAKKYTDEDLVKMINAVLDKFMKEEL